MSAATAVPCRAASGVDALDGVRPLCAGTVRVSPVLSVASTCGCRTTTPGDGAYNPGEGNAPNLNAAIGGGPANKHGAQPGAHGLCGGSVSTSPGQSEKDSSFMAQPINGANLEPLYGPTEPRGTFVAGGTMAVTAKVTA